MAKTTINIPKMDAAIICRNNREAKAARIFVDDMRDVAIWAAESDDANYWARRVVDVGGCCERYVEELNGMSSVFYYMGMLEEPISSVEIHRAIVGLYEDELTARAADDEDAAADADMDAIKADAAYCLGIIEGSDEWYALMDI